MSASEASSGPRSSSMGSVMIGCPSAGSFADISRAQSKFNAIGQPSPWGGSPDRSVRPVPGTLGKVATVPGGGAGDGGVTPGSAPPDVALPVPTPVHHVHTLTATLRDH